MDLSTSIRYIKGVGPAKEKLFNKLNIYTVGDLLYYFPRDYEDRTKVKKLIEIADGEKAVFEARIMSSVTNVMTRSRMKIYKAVASDDTGRINLTWFNTDYIKNILKPGQKYLFYGQINRAGNMIEIRNPIFETYGTNKNIGRILPIYSTTNGLTQNSIRDAVKYILQELNINFEDSIPKSIRIKEKLTDINNALISIHFPNTEVEYVDARRRLAFEELLILQVGLMQLKKATDTDDGIVFEKSAEIDKFIKTLPFTLTNAQNKVLNDILNDMASIKPMRRLLQGDVGSGKTIISLLAILNAVQNGYQAVLMAPTGILAEQHLETFKEMLKAYDIKVELLSSSIKTKEKRNIKEKIALGMVDVVIGTHAILEDDVTFKNLGLVVTDEQHRFGVNQRSKLSEKGNNPDVLVMTATPIPRTLALILYGDLDISVIDELPPNRKKIETFLIDESFTDRVNGFIEKEVENGRQVYIVCPLIEESEPDEEEEEQQKSKLKDVMTVASECRERFPNMTIEILHGKIKSAQKDEIMARFKNGETDILISTTVIEVGVNVPNATIMMIENAERFGLAALHQLRGRVGRGSNASYCILKCHSMSKVIKERMEIMTKTDNGFKIAEKDLELRGPGEFLGIKQHGVPEFKVANIFADADMLEITTKWAKTIINEKNDEYDVLFNKVKEKFKDIVL